MSQKCNQPIPVTDKSQLQTGAWYFFERRRSPVIGTTAPRGGRVAGWACVEYRRPAPERTAERAPHTKERGSTHGTQQTSIHGRNPWSHLQIAILFGYLAFCDEVLVQVIDWRCLKHRIQEGHLHPYFKQHMHAVLYMCLCATRYRRSIVSNVPALALRL